VAAELNPYPRSRDGDDGKDGFRGAAAAVHAMGPRSRRTPLWILALMHSRWARIAFLDSRSLAKLEAAERKSELYRARWLGGG
jgi:hypothetical protein